MRADWKTEQWGAICNFCASAAKVAATLADELNPAGTGTCQPHLGALRACTWSTTLYLTCFPRPNSLSGPAGVRCFSSCESAMTSSVMHHKRRSSPAC